MATDGKHLARIPEWRLRAIITRQTPLDGQKLTNTKLRAVLKSQLPYVQWHERKEGPSYGAEQLMCVEWVVADDDGDTTVGNRFFRHLTEHRQTRFR